MAITKVEYEAEIIQQFAADLYKRARSLTATYAVGFGIIGLVVAFMFSSGEAAAMTAIVLTAIGALAGYSIGQNKAFQLKLEAQTALAQVQIERNTRAVGSREPT